MIAVSQCRTPAREIFRCPLLAQNGHGDGRLPRQLSAVKRSLRFDRVAAAFDPTRTYAQLSWQELHAYVLITQLQSFWTGNFVTGERLWDHFQFGIGS